MCWNRWIRNQLAQIERLSNAASYWVFAPAWLQRDNFCGRADGRFLSARNPLVAELGNPMGQSGYLTARRFLVDDAGASRPHQGRLGRHQGRLSGSLVTAIDGVFDTAQRRSHARAAGFIHFGAARDLARGLLGRFGVGHRSVPGFASVIANDAAVIACAKKRRRRDRRREAPLIVGSRRGVNAKTTRQDAKTEPRLLNLMP